MLEDRATFTYAYMQYGAGTNLAETAKAKRRRVACLKSIAVFVSEERPERNSNFSRLSRPQLFVPSSGIKICRYKLWFRATGLVIEPKINFLRTRVD